MCSCGYSNALAFRRCECRSSCCTIQPFTEETTGANNRVSHNNIVAAIEASPIVLQVNRWVEVTLVGETSIIINCGGSAILGLEQFAMGGIAKSFLGKRYMLRIMSSI